MSKSRTTKNALKLYFSTFYALAADPVNPPKCIPIKEYCTKYFVSVEQIKRLLRKKQLCAVSFKSKLFVTDIPPPMDC